MSKKKIPLKQEDIKQDKIAPLDKHEEKVEEVDMATLIRKQDAQIKEAEMARSEFISKQNKWYRQRYGLRKKATFPWYNSSSMHLPMQDKHIRAMKPEYVGVAYNTYPMCELSTKYESNELISEAASFHFDWLLRTRMDVFEDVVLMADKMLHKGFCIVKTIYEKSYEPKIVSIDRAELKDNLLKQLLNKQDISILDDPSRINQLAPIIARLYDFDFEDADDAAKVSNICLEIYKGTDIIEFTVQEIKYDAPKLIVLDPEEIIVPADTESVFDLEKARWVCHQYYTTPAEALKNANIGKWDADEVSSLMNKFGVYDEDLRASKYQTGGPAVKDTTGLQQKRQREGLQWNGNMTESNILVKEVCMWWDADGDGIEERYILEFAEGREKPLRFIRYPYTSLKAWPYVKVIFELADKRHYANRGTVEIEEPMASALNVQHNMKINRQTISSTPTLLYAANKVNPNNFQYIPGQAIPVETPIEANAKWFMPQNTDATFMEEENVLKAWSEEILAANDYGVQRNQGGKTTATEINYNANSRVGIRQLDIQIWQKALKEIYKRIFSLWLEFSSEDKFVYQDSDGTQKVMDKASLNRDYTFQPMGSFGSSNPQLSAQIAQRMFELFREDPMVDKYEVYREFITKQGDMRLCKRILKSKKQIADDQSAQQQMMEQAHMKSLQEQIAVAQMTGKNVPAPVQRATQTKQLGLQEIKGNGNIRR